MTKKIIIGTRGSKLAISQAEEIKHRLIQAHGLTENNFEIKVIKTSGDKFLQANLSKIGGKGLFTKEIEEQLLSGTINLAVHSMKDMPAHMPEGLKIINSPEEASPFDIFLSTKYKSLEQMPANAIIGTSSARRAFQCQQVNPNVKIKPIRGNINSRIAKLLANEIDGIILAKAGIDRLNLYEFLRQNKIFHEILTKNQMLPPAGQGALALQICENDHEIEQLLSSITDGKTSLRIAIERNFIKEFGASCTTPIGIFAHIIQHDIYFSYQYFSNNGKIFQEEIKCNESNCLEVSKNAAVNLLKQIQND